jgi:hypothetical protein
MNRPTFTIASSWFNVEKAGFAWREAAANWLDFLGGDGQLVIAINTSEDDSPRLVREWTARWQAEHADSATRIDILDIAIPYTDAAFDGKGKAAATAAATEPYVILLDADERLVPRMRRKWDALALELERSPYEAFLVPVVDLLGDEQHYKDCGQKWYLHKRLPHLTRGVVKQAWNPDGVTWDTSRSDSCELIHRETGELARAAGILMGLPHYMTVPQMESGEVPFVTHLGYIDLEQRVRQSAFWRPVWDSRCQPGKEPETTLATLEAIPRYRHNLPSWRDHS